jgi:bifunctional DNA-binding transcriptional regulator/antitoxin component of YhaV-PrlF toxin-antitoxin module
MTMQTFTTTSRLVRVRSRGQLTIPQDLREALDLDEETGLNVFRVGRVLLMTPKRLQRGALASDVEREMKREGVTLEALLKDLKDQRKRYLAETYRKD